MTTKPDTKQKALDILHAGVADIMSSDGWRRTLKFRNKFHNYSFFNTTLILAQNPDATLVAGYRRWQELDRQVRKGEKGMVVLAPLTKKDPDDPDERILFGFRGVYVFDISQTDGEPVPTPERPELLQGDGAEIREALKALESFCREKQILVSRNLEATTALGSYRPKTNSIALRRDLPPLQELKTFTHEIAHALLHRNELDRRIAELEAESCAFLVLHELGVDSSLYSFKYIASWADGLDALIAAGDQACRAADRILEALRVQPDTHSKTTEAHAA